MVVVVVGWTGGTDGYSTVDSTDIGSGSVELRARDNYWSSKDVYLSYKKGSIDEVYVSLPFAYSIGLGPNNTRVIPYNHDQEWSIQEPILRGRTSTISTPTPMGMGEEGFGLCKPEYKWDCSWAVRLVGCESSGRERVIGSTVIDGVTYHFYGLLQIYHPDKPGPTNEYLLDPVLNIIEGHIQYVQWSRGERSNPWPICP